MATVSEDLIYCLNYGDFWNRGDFLDEDDFLKDGDFIQNGTNCKLSLQQELIYWDESFAEPSIVGKLPKIMDDLSELYFFMKYKVFKIPYYLTNSLINKSKILKHICVRLMETNRMDDEHKFEEEENRRNYMLDLECEEYLIPDKGVCYEHIELMGH